MVRTHSQLAGLLTLLASLFILPLQAQTVQWIGRGDTTAAYGKSWYVWGKGFVLPDGGRLFSQSGIPSWFYGGTTDSLATRAYARSLSGGGLGSMAYADSAYWRTTVNERIAYSDTTSIVANQWRLGAYKSRSDSVRGNPSAFSTWAKSRDDSSFSASTYTPLTRSLTIAGNAPLSFSAGAQNLSADRTWTGSIDTTRGKATALVTQYIHQQDSILAASKQASGNYITALTGDVTASGPGSVAATLATVASAGTTGSSTAIPVITINAKGLTTSITTAAVVAPAGTLTGTTLASGVTASSLTSTALIDTFYRAYSFKSPSAVDSTLFWECREGNGAVITIREVRVIRIGGTSATINVTKNTTSDIIANYVTSTSLATAGGLTNNTLVSGDFIRATIRAISGTPTEIFIQLMYTKPRTAG